MMHRKVCSWKCFSFGVHIDFRYKTVDFHIWNWFLSTSNYKHSSLGQDYWDYHNKLMEVEEKWLKEHYPNWHPVVI